MKHKLLQDQESLLIVHLLRNSGISLKKLIPGSETGKWIESNGHVWSVVVRMQRQSISGL